MLGRCRRAGLCLVTTPVGSIGPTFALAEFVANGRPSALPPAVLHQACRCLVDVTGVALGGQSHRSLDILLDYAATVGGRRQATVLGRGVRVNVPAAALLNAQAAHIEDFDDTLMSSETSLHGTAPVYSAALAMGEWLGKPGLEVLNAFVLGFEVAARVALALGPAHYAAGWHVTGTSGRFGAAAAAGKLLGLDAGQQATALGIVGTQASGLKAAYGTMSKAHHAARAAHDGVVAAMLAQRGFTGSQQVLEATYGLLELYTTDPHPERLAGPPDGHYLVLEDGFKPYPCGSLIHATIDATLDIAERDRPDPARIREVVAHVNPHVVTTTGRQRPASGLEAKFSAHHCVAVTLLQRRGVVGDDFIDPVALDPAVVALRERVRLDPDPAYGKEHATVTVVMDDGTEYRSDVPAARGTTGRPLEDAAVSQKFLGLAEPVLGPRRAASVLDSLWHFDALGDVRPAIRRIRARR